MNSAPGIFLTSTFFRWICVRWDQHKPALVASRQFLFSKQRASTGETFISHQDPDVALIMRYQEGDVQAFETLFHKWKRPLISFLYRSIGNISEAEEIALEVFVKIHQSIHRYKPTAKFSSYLFFIGRRLMLNHFRKHNRKPLDIIDPSDLSFIHQTAAEDANTLREMEESMQAALMKLPELQRTALLLMIQQQLQPHEIAKIIGKKPSATRVMIHRARETLKTELEHLK